MPSWVVPSVAAELWGVTVEHVLSEVAAGRIISRTEGEFVFVDVDPNAAAQAEQDAEKRPSTYRRSLTWSIGTSEHVQQPLVTAAERDALLSDDADDSDTSTIDLNTPSGDPPAEESRTLTDDDTPDWEAVRARVGRTRIPPRSASRAAAA